MFRTPSFQTAKILLYLYDQPEPRYGREIAARTRIPWGSIYSLLAYAQENGYVRSHWEQISPAANHRGRRRFYALTPVGIRAAESCSVEVSLLAELKAAID